MNLDSTTLQLILNLIIYLITVIYFFASLKVKVDVLINEFSEVKKKVNSNCIDIASITAKLEQIERKIERICNLIDESLYRKNGR